MVTRLFMANSYAAQGICGKRYIVTFWGADEEPAIRAGFARRNLGATLTAHIMRTGQS